MSEGIEEKILSLLSENFDLTTSGVAHKLGKKPVLIWSVSRDLESQGKLIRVKIGTAQVLRLPPNKAKVNDLG